MKENKSFISRSKGNIGLKNDLDLGKLPPQALDLEESVLGALMLEKDALTDNRYFKTRNFIKMLTKKFITTIDLFNNSEPVDLPTVTTQLKNES